MRLHDAIEFGLPQSARLTTLVDEVLPPLVSVLVEHLPQFLQPAVPPSEVSGGNNAVSQRPSVKKYEAENRCLAHPSRMLARRGASPVEVERQSWSWLAFRIAGSCALLVLGAYALRHRNARRDDPSYDDAASKSPSSLETVVTIVGICAGVAGLVTVFVPGVAARERPSPATTIAVRAVNPRVTRGEFAKSTGDHRRMERLDRREVGNVIWVQLHFVHLDSAAAVSGVAADRSIRRGAAVSICAPARRPLR
jgi:hypothetical protein